MSNKFFSKRWEIKLDLKLSIDKYKKHFKNGEIFLSVPTSRGIRQKVLEIYTNRLVNLTNDKWGNNWISIPVQKNFIDKRFYFKAYIILETSNIFYDWDIFRDKDWEIPEKRFIEDEKGIESSSKEILKLRDKIKSKLPKKIIQEAFFLVRKTLKYKIQKDEYGAKYAATKKVGDCTEFASLFCALLRSKGIGARLMLGVYPTGEYHAISEIYMDSLWVPLDITNITLPILKNDVNFLNLMQGNWMANRSEQFISFYFSTSSKDFDVKLKDNFKILNFVDNTFDISEKKIEDLCNKYPYKVKDYKRSIVEKLKFNIKESKKLDSYIIEIYNPVNFKFKGHFILLGEDLDNNKFLLKKIKIIINPLHKEILKLSLKEMKKKIKDFQYLILLLFDNAETSFKIIKKIKRSDLLIEIISK